LLILFSPMLLFSYLPAQNRVDVHGLRQGKWMGTYSNGAVRYRGQFRNGHPYGTFDYYYPTGTLKARMDYSHNGHVAYLRSYHLNGKLLATGKFVDHKKDSTWLYYSDVDGKLVLEENYKMGVKNGPTIVFYPSTGKPAEITNYKNGLKNGPWIRNFPNGAVSTSGIYVRDTLQGPFLVYGINGKLLIKGQYKNAMQEGMWYTYDTLGHLVKKQLFHGGLPVKAKKN